MTVKTLIPLGSETLNFDYTLNSVLIPGLTFSAGSTEAVHIYGAGYNSGGFGTISRINITSVDQFSGVDGIVFNTIPKLLQTNEYAIDTSDNNAYYLIHIINPTRRIDGDLTDGITYEAWKYILNNPPTGNVTITGVAEQNQKLIADTTTLADADGLGTISYQWLSYSSPISGATQNTYTVAMNDLYANISVTASYTDGLGKIESVSSSAVTIAAPINYPPTGNVIISGTATQNQTLTVSNTLADSNNLGAISYQWWSGDTLVSNNQASYTLTQNDVGKNVRVMASYTDGLGKIESVNSNAVKIANLNDSPTGNVTISGTTTQGQVLTASNSLTDLDGLGTINHQWLNAGLPIFGANQPTYTLTSADVGKAISVQASYTDLQGTAESVTSSETALVAGLQSAPTGNVAISGTPTQNQTLTASNTLADANDLGTIGYQWLSNGVEIAGKTQSTYTLSQTDVGKAISVKASYTDGLNKLESVTSNATGLIIGFYSTLFGTNYFNEDWLIYWW